MEEDEKNHEENAAGVSEAEVASQMKAKYVEINVEINPPIQVGCDEIKARTDNPYPNGSVIGISKSEDVSKISPDVSETENNNIITKNHLDALINESKDRVTRLDGLVNGVAKKRAADEISLANGAKEVMAVRLVGLGSAMDPKHLRVEIRTPVFTIGRSLTANLLIKDISISREQAVFQWTEEEGHWTITDRSSNGIRINGVRIPKEQPTVLRLRDKIMLSDQKDRYNWRLLPAQEEEKQLSSEGLMAPPPAKRVKFVSLPVFTPLRVQEDRASLARNLAEYQLLAERRLQQERSRLESKVQEGEKRQAVLLQERDHLQERLAEQRQQMETSQLEQRAEMERKLEEVSQEERDKERARLEQELNRQRDSFQAERLAQERELEVRLEVAEAKLRQEVEQRDQRLALLATEKEELEQRFSEEQSLLQQRLNSLELKLEEENSCRESKEAEWRERIEALARELEAKKEEERLRLEQELSREKEEKEQIQAEMEEQKRRLEQERESFDRELEQMRKERERTEEEHRLSAQKREEERSAQEAAIAAQIAAEREQAARTVQENEAKVMHIAGLEAELETVRGEAEAKRRAVLSRLEDTLEQQLVCATCLELPVNPVALNCAHSYCWLCLEQWKRSSGNTTCPQCRVAIVTEARVISMDNMIEALIAQLGPDKVEERRRQVELRLEQEQLFRRQLEDQPAIYNQRGRASNIRGGARGRPARGGNNRASTENAGPGARLPLTITGNLPAARGRAAGTANIQVIRLAAAPAAIRAAAAQGGSVAAAVAPGQQPMSASFPVIVRQAAATAAGQTTTAQPAAAGSVSAQQRPVFYQIFQSANPGTPFAVRLAGPPAAPVAHLAAPSAAPQPAQSSRAAVLQAPAANVGAPVARPAAAPSARALALHAAAAAAGRQAAAVRDAIVVSSDSETDDSSQEPDDSYTATTPSDSDTEENTVVPVESSDGESDEFYNGDGSSQEVEGLPGTYYGGYGRCFRCNMTGHWAPGCPFHADSP